MQIDLPLRAKGQNEGEQLLASVISMNARNLQAGASTKWLRPQDPTKSPPLSVSGSPGGRSCPLDKYILDNFVFATKGWVRILWVLKLLLM